MKIFKFVYLGILCAFIISCATTKTKTVSTSHDTRISEIKGAGVLHLPVIVDLEVNEEPVEGISSGFIDIELLKEAAFLEAMRKTGNKADVLIHPKFSTEKIDNGATQVKVVAFPGYYKNFRQAEHDDIELLQIGELKPVNVFSPQAVYTQTKTTYDDTFLIILAGLLGLTSLIIIINI